MKLQEKPQPDLTVLLPKNAFKAGSRNSLSELVAEAGYNDAANGKMGRFDQVTSTAGFYESEKDVDLRIGEVRFRFVKDLGRLATQMRLLQLKEKSAIVITGSDSLLEAYLRVTQQVQGVVLEKVADLGIGKCSLEWLTPNEDPANVPEELSGRELFSKYPEVMKYLLKQSETDAQCFESGGADTNINDFREEGITNTGALEIVGSGQTSTDLDLFRQSVDDEVSPVKDIKFSSISTDIFIINPQKLAQRTRAAAMGVCDAFESARPIGAFSNIKINALESKLEAIKALNLGLVGPSIQQVLSDDGEKWVDITLLVPDENANGVNAQIKLILEDKGSSSISARGIKQGGNARTSQSIQYLSK